MVFRGILKSIENEMEFSLRNELALPETEALIHRCSVKKVFLKILQNSQENTCARVSF